MPEWKHLIDVRYRCKNCSLFWWNTTKHCSEPSKWSYFWLIHFKHILRVGYKGFKNASRCQITDETNQYINFWSFIFFFESQHNFRSTICSTIAWEVWQPTFYSNFSWSAVPKILFNSPFRFNHIIHSAS